MLNQLANPQAQMKPHLFSALDKAGKANHKRRPGDLYKPEIKDSLIREIPHRNLLREVLRTSGAPCSLLMTVTGGSRMLIHGYHLKKGFLAHCQQGDALPLPQGDGQCARQA